MFATTVFDSVLFGDIFGTQEARECFSERAYVSHMIDAECALAAAEEAEGIIPAGAADAIRQHSDVSKVDWRRLAARTTVVGYPVLPLIEQMAEWCPPEHAAYIHWGATTQDIMDLAAVLQMREGLALVERGLGRVTAHLRGLARRHRDTAMAGRTHLQHALPVTFGFKCGVWLAGLQRHAERLGQIRGRCLLAQLGGAAGTLAALGGRGVAVRRRLAAGLRLRDPVVPWHAGRDTVAEVVGFLALVGGTLGKIGLDLIVLASTEVAEVAEPYAAHRGASSTMPQKRNPISSEVMLAQSKLLRAQAGLALDAVVADFERASGPWHLEWAAVPTAFVAALGSLHQADFALAGLQVNEGAMLNNLQSTRGLIVAEAVMMALAAHLGRQQAHEVVYQACVKAHEGGRSLLEVLQEVPAVTAHLSDEELTDLCDPKKYMGSCQVMVDELLAQHN